MAEQRKANPELPEGQWSVNNDDKKKIRELGRKLHSWLLQQAGAGPFHTKYVAGAFQYVMELQQQKGKALADDFAYAQRGIEQFGLGEAITEPFEEYVDPTPETPMQKKERLLKEAAAVDFEDASVRPTEQSNPPKDEATKAEALAPTGPTGPGMASPIQQKDLREGGSGLAGATA